MPLEQGPILVTGGAGYIGSHVVRQLGARGETVITLDNLSSGFRDAVLFGELIEGDSGDEALVSRVLAQYQVRAVMHFAAHTIVPESVTDPLKYYHNNTVNTARLLRCCRDAGIEHLIFSSTAAVYGNVQGGEADESTPAAPESPYGWSKLMSEQMIRDTSRAHALRHVILRYFNVAGSDPQGRIGQRTANATLLTKVAAEVATGKRPALQVFGTDYPTPDGTGVRDYIHVEDLASAHLKALDYLRAGGRSTTLNCGYGQGYSVRDVIAAVESVTGTPLPVEEKPRRAGDIASLIARADAIRDTLGWQPAHNDLKQIVRDAIRWEQAH